MDAGSHLPRVQKRAMKAVWGSPRFAFPPSLLLTEPGTLNPFLCILAAFFLPCSRKESANLHFPYGALRALLFQAGCKQLTAEGWKITALHRAASPGDSEWLREKHEKRGLRRFVCLFLWGNGRCADYISKVSRSAISAGMEQRRRRDFDNRME